MKSNKKLLISLLSAACAIAGVIGLAACKPEVSDPRAAEAYDRQKRYQLIHRRACNAGRNLQLYKRGGLLRF